MQLRGRESHRDVQSAVNAAAFHRRQRQKRLKVKSSEGGLDNQPSAAPLAAGR